MSSIVSFSCDSDFAEILRAYCANRGVSRSLFIRQAIRTAMRGQESVLGPQVHVSPPQVRRKRPDEKCNPMLPRKCAICWPMILEEEE